MRALLLAHLALVLSAAEPWTVWNCTGTDWKQEPLRVPTALDAAPALAVAGKILPQQWVEADGRKVRWVALDAAPDAVARAHRGRRWMCRCKSLLARAGRHKPWGRGDARPSPGAWRGAA